MTLPLPDPLIVTPRGRIGDDVADPWGVQRNLEAIAAAFPVHAANLASDVLLLAVSGTKRVVDLGVANVTLPAATSGTFTINHSLGVAPVVALTLPNGATANDLTVGVGTFTSTQFTVAWRRASGSNAGFALNWYWLAIG